MYHLSTNDMGDTGGLKGTLNNHNYELFCLKYIDFVMKIISTYSGLTEYPSQKVSMCSFAKNVGDAKTAHFKYKIILSNHFKYYRAVNNHNNLWHLKTSPEETWVTQLWPNRVFSSFLAISDLNFHLEFRSFLLVNMRRQFNSSNLEKTCLRLHR